MNEKNELNTNLDPEVEKIRDQIISKIGDKPLEEVNKIIKKLLMENMDETMRLAALAARVKIIRGKISLLYDNKIEINKPKQPASKKSYEKPIIKEEKWVRIKMLESGEVNGKQIDKDVILDVKDEDSKILINAKKAEIFIEKSDTADKPSPMKKRDVDPEKKESIKTDNKEETGENKFDISTNEAEQNIEDANKKDLLDKHAKKEKDKVRDNSVSDTKDLKSDENNTAESTEEAKFEDKVTEPAAPSSEGKPVEEVKVEDKNKDKDKVTEPAAPSSEGKPAEEVKVEDKDKVTEPAVPSSEGKLAEEAKGEDKQLAEIATPSEGKPAEEAKVEDNPVEQAVASSNDKPVEEKNA